MFNKNDKNEIQKIIGPTSVAIYNFFWDRDDAKDVFFKPIKNRADGLYRLSLVFTGPLLSTLAAITGFSLGVHYSIQAKNTSDAKIRKDNFKICAEIFLTSALMLLTAVLTPLINAIDLLGGALKTGVSALAQP